MHRMVLASKTEIICQIAFMVVAVVFVVVFTVAGCSCCCCGNTLIVADLHKCHQISVGLQCPLDVTYI